MGRSCTEEELCERDTIEVRYNGISLGERGASQPDDGVTIRGWERLIESAGAHNLHHHLDERKLSSFISTYPCW